MASCTICNTPNAKACKRCLSAHYCSKECQHVDWRTHRLLCAELSNFSERPGPMHKRAIFFPDSDRKPRFIWAKFESLRAYDALFVDGYLGPDKPDPQRVPVQHNLLRRRDLVNSLVLICRDGFTVDGSCQNQSVATVCGGAMGYNWRGPLVVYKKTGDNAFDGFCLDMDLNDFRDLVDHLIAYGNEAFQESTVEAKDKVRGVKINCVGEMKISGAAEFIEIQVPKEHPAFYAPVAPMSRLVGLPLRVRKYPPNESWSSFQNIAATFLHLEPDPTKDTWEHDATKSMWGWAPMIWQSGVGSVLAVRSDKKDVTKYQVEALCHYCQYEMQPLFEECMEIEGEEFIDNESQEGRTNHPGRLRREKVMEHLTPARFGEFFEKFKRQKASEDPSWVNARVGDLG